MLRRIEPVASIVQALIGRGDVHAGLMMVRYIGIADADKRGGGGDKRGGGGDVGWIITPAQLALLASMGASLQADEYMDD